MNITTEKKIIEIAKYIIEYKATINEAAEYFNMSSSSIKKYINNPDKLQSINKGMYDAVKAIQEVLTIEGQKKGGKIGKRTYSLTLSEITILANEIVARQYTLEQAATNLNVKKSTLYDNLKRIEEEPLKSDIRKLFNNNKGLEEGDEPFGQPDRHI